MKTIRIILPDPPYFDTKPLESLRSGAVSITIYNDLAVDSAQLQSRIVDADIIVVDILSDYNESSLANCHSLKHLITASVGVNHIDLAYCEKRGIKVHRFANYNSRAVAEMAFANLISLLRHVPHANNTVRSNLWLTDYFMGEELAGKTIGIIGAGNIGRELIKISHGFGMKVLCTTKNPTPTRATELGLDQFSSLQDVLNRSNFVILAATSDQSNANMINATTLMLMKRSSYLINVARHFLVDAKALAGALYRRELAGAALDFVGPEPYHLYSDDLEIQEMVNRPNVIVTPHIGFNTKEASHRLSLAVRDQVQSLLNGQ